METGQSAPRETVARHLRAADVHDARADEHDSLAARWHEQGDAERAALEIRIALFERQLALLERDRADLEERRATEGR